MSVIFASILLAVAIEFPMMSETNLRRLTSGYDVGIGAFEFFLDPDGVVLGCEVPGFALPNEDIARFCDRAVGRDAGRGARGPDGSPVHALVVGSAIFGINPNRDELVAQNPDLVILVSSMPGDQERYRTATAVMIDETGGVGHCEPIGNSAFAAVACEQLAHHRFTVRHGSLGEPVAYVYSPIVDFVLEGVIE